MRGAYYNEIDPYAAAWLRNLIQAGLIASGDVDERSIAEVAPDDLSGYTQIHLFAGFGGWSYAARLAGWPDDADLWTGSCPCQPFSVAGKGEGEADARHLWPQMRRLLTECRPPVVAGEQVAGKAGRAWLDGVRADLEGLGYAVGGADLCAASAGAPHIRQRLFWVADAGSERVRGLRSGEAGGATATRESEGAEWERVRPDARAARSGLGDAPLGGFGIHGSTSGDTGHVDESGQVSGVGESFQPRLEGLTRHGYDGDESRRQHTDPTGPVAAASGSGGMADTDGRQPGDRRVQPGGEHGQQSAHGGPGFWGTFDLLPCLDGKARRVEPGTFPLAHGIPARVGKLRAYGNAIVPEIAASFLVAYLEARASYAK